MAYAPRTESRSPRKYIAFLVQNVLDHCEGAYKPLTGYGNVKEIYAIIPRISYDEAIGSQKMTLMLIKNDLVHQRKLSGRPL